MNSQTVQSVDEPGGSYVRIPLPLGDREAFRHGATADILHILAGDPGATFSNRELRRLTGKGMSNVNAAVRSLEALGVIRVDRDGRSNAVGIDPARFVRSDDPVTTISQPEFQPPVRAVRNRLVERIGTDAAIVLFGSVARGEADRTSDIDVFVVVENGRMAAQRIAHEVEAEIATERFEGDRYEPHIVVETRASAATHDRIRDVLVDGIPLQHASILQDVKRAVLEDGS